jgi:hypothetical protein
MKIIDFIHDYANEYKLVANVKDLTCFPSDFYKLRMCIRRKEIKINNI